MGNGKNQKTTKSNSDVSYANDQLGENKDATYQQGCGCGDGKSGKKAKKC